jgi:GYF domain 2
MSHLDMNTTLQIDSETTSSAADVYLSVAGQQLGPYCLPRALAVVRRNRLEAQAWLWRAGMAEWQRMTDYLKIRSVFRRRPAARSRG